MEAKVEKEYNEAEDKLIPCEYCGCTKFDITEYLYTESTMYDENGVIMATDCHEAGVDPAERKVTCNNCRKTFYNAEY